ncbi:CrcB-like protein [Paucilactobacillus hokkaidonensis JCM 18461]|uniref:Fluoride-specific ion channel FluC n=2 Tax=Paucilactobacillus hokkaidonensis TaxID=1193095 RepID=A0A0A1GX29_9LACO|nr:CrcB family protein [Paucilactobacillus hokkaidonensis]KRO11423.1 hypothetical protein IV59_GL000163 [Paucilactobacillus hokkaidonensis]BAP85026.1 CrcB-like protein [Paucilactobacillus hokkaidonensis JCM 18461]
MSFPLTLLIGFTAGLGACARLLIMELFKKSDFWQKLQFPVSTFLINIVGTLTLSFIFWHFQPSWINKFITTGFIGGFTTFSTFNNEIIILWHSHHYATGISYGIATYVTGIAAALAGMWL